MRRSKIRNARKHSGAALLVFMLLIVVSASTLLLTKINAAVRSSVYSPVTSSALNEAKVALIAWAVNHPFNPGTLPMPDRNGDGNYDGDSDCFNGTIGNNLLLGKLPWRGYPSPCKDAGSIDGLSLFVTDRSGEQLWYAVSKNLVYESPNYPFISPGLLKKSSDWITVRDQSGEIISERVAFVVIAPGPALFPYTNCDGLSYTGQDRSGNAPAIQNYLDSVTINGVTYSNADYDQDFIIYPDSRTTIGSSSLEKCDQFNDQLVFVTIDELMNAVSVRVLNETANALTTYHNANGAMPWLVPFADPKAEPKILIGTTTTTSNNLVDTTVNFTEWGVIKEDLLGAPPVQGDVVWNLTDGSRGVVTDVAVNMLTIGAGLKFGLNNTFSVGDRYYIETSGVASKLTGTATFGTADLTLVDIGRNFENLGILNGDIIDNLTDGSSGVISIVDGSRISVTSLGGGNNTGTASVGSAGLMLKDITRNFEILGIAAGDVVDNLTDNSSGIISLVNDDEITVLALNGGSNNVFQTGDNYRIRSNNVFKIGDNYRIRSNAGQVTSTNIDPLILEDTKADFTKMGVLANDIVKNLTTGAVGRVASIISVTQLKFDALKHGINSEFKSDDYYYISRHNGREYTKSGLIPIHQKGQVISTGFSIDWYSPNSSGSVTMTLATDTIYTNAIRSYAGASSGYSGTVTVDATDAKCMWISYEFVSCKGVYEDTNADFLAGTATSGSSSLVLRDFSKNFSTLGTKRGDKVRNTTDNTTGIVFNTTSTQLTLVNISGLSPVTMDVGDSYQIELATSSFTFSAASPSSSFSNRVYYSDSTSSSSYLDETKLAVGDTIENMDGSTSIGRITSIFTGSNYFEHSILQGGGYLDVFNGETVRIRHNFISKRQYEFDLTMKGTATETTISGNRERSVCRGYDTSCLTPLNNAALKGDGTTAFVTIRDYEGSTEVGRATNILPVAGLSSRSLKVSGLEFYMDEGYGDLSEWFVRNKWHQYVLVAYNSDDAPGGATCIQGDPNNPCLTLNLRNTENAVVSSKNNIRAVVMLSRNELPSQAWTNAHSFDYFENDQVASSGTYNLTLVDSDKKFVDAGVVVGDKILNRTDGSKGIIISVSQTEIEVDSLTGGDENVFRPGDRYSLDSLYRSDPKNYPFNKYVESSSFNDLMRLAISCESDATKLCWSN